LGGLLSSIGIVVPFFVAGGLSLIAAFVGWCCLHETHKPGSKKQVFTYKSLWTILKRPIIGPAILTGFLLTTAQFVMLIGFQTFCTDALKLSPTQIGVFYAGFGIAGIVMQLGIPLVNNIISSRSVILLVSTFICLAAIVFSGFATSIWPFAAGIGLYGFFNGIRNPMLNAIIADQNDSHEQGEIMGINQSYISIGQALGPAIAGVAASFSLHVPFFVSGLLITLGIIVAFRLKRKESPAKK
jgi:predicted MFS family arabinose efflux permease